MEPSRDLADRIRSGDRAAFDELCDGFWRSVLGYFYRRSAGKMADELAQIVFVNVYRTLKRGGGRDLVDRESWSRYLFTVARNALRDHWRETVAAVSSYEELFPEEHAESFARQIPDDDPGGDTLEAEETRAALVACLDLLDLSARRLVWLHFVEGRSKRELARAAERPESSVRVDMVRAVQTLRRCVEGKGITP